MPFVSRAQSVPSDSVLRGFQPIGEYTLVIDGKPVPAAEIYQNELPAILILTSALSSPVLLTPRAGSYNGYLILAGRGRNLLQPIRSRHGHWHAHWRA